ncbi:MAG: MFS transporter [Kofleriaceae bacterium]|nr:MFS transporter [Kofleriaceae bacterium]
MNTIQTWRASLALLTTRRFGTFWFASLLSSIGTWTQQVAEPWLLLALGASPFLVGLNAFAMSAPGWLLTLAGGALADRKDRRMVIAIFQTIQMLCPAAIVVLLLLGAVTPWIIIGLSVVVGITDALSMPSFQSIVPSIVSHDQLARGIALNTTQFNLSRMLGPAIAGVLMASVGAVACFAVSAVSYIPFVGVALWILPRGVPRTTDSTPAVQHNTWRSIKQIWQQPHVRGALLTVFVGCLLGAPLVTFTPILVTQAFGGDASVFSIAMTAFGAGGLLGAVALLGVPSHVDRRHLSAYSAMMNGMIVVLIALNPWQWGLPPLLVLASATMTISLTAADVVLQATAPRVVLGQTVSLYLLALSGGISLGALLTGVTVGWLGVQPALLVDGALAVVVLLLVARTWLRAPHAVAAVPIEAG